MLSIHLNT